LKGAAVKHIALAVLVTALAAGCGSSGGGTATTGSSVTTLHPSSSSSSSGAAAALSPEQKACAADLGDLKAVYKLARHAGLGLGPNIYLAQYTRPPKASVPPH
jgi:hypothetical protein